MEARITAFVALVGLAACGLPEDADVAPSAHVLAAPAPMLLPDVTFRTALAEARPAETRIEAEAAILTARAEALAARAGALSDPVIEPEMRARLQAASAAPAAEPPAPVGTISPSAH